MGKSSSLSFDTIKNNWPLLVAIVGVAMMWATNQASLANIGHNQEETQGIIKELTQKVDTKNDVQDERISLNATDIARIKAVLNTAAGRNLFAALNNPLFAQLPFYTAANPSIQNAQSNNMIPQSSQQSSTPEPTSAPASIGSISFVAEVSEPTTKKGKEINGNANGLDKKL